MKDFKVTVRRTEASERCGLKGIVLLRTDSDSLLLKEPKTGEVLYSWPYRFLRRFGRDKVCLSRWPTIIHLMLVRQAWCVISVWVLMPQYSDDTVKRQSFRWDVKVMSTPCMWGQKKSRVFLENNFLPIILSWL